MRFICGTFSVHRDLEAACARLVGTPASLSFVSCWNANEALPGTLLGEEDIVISDQLNHASIIDGIRLGEGDHQVPDRRLSPCRHGRPRREARRGARPSNRGWSSPTASFRWKARSHRFPICSRCAAGIEAVLVVDDSHATGVLGANGRGTAEHFDVVGEIDIITSTLGKALGGAAGGFAAGSAAVCDYLTQRARPQLFSNALPPTVAASALASIEFLEAHPERVDAAARQRPLLPSSGCSSSASSRCPGRPPSSRSFLARPPPRFR